MKKVLILGIIILAVFLIYLANIDKNVYYLALGDKIAESYPDKVKEYLENKDLLEIFIKDYIKEEYRITDIIHDIDDNKKIVINGKEKTLKNALIKSDLVTLSVGTNDLMSKVTTYDSNLYEYVDEIVDDLEKLFIKLREYCKEDIILVGYYYPKNVLNNEKLLDVFRYANEKFKEKSEEYDILYIDISTKINEKLLDKNGIYPSDEGYNVIFEEVRKVIDNTLLK